MSINNSVLWAELESNGLVEEQAPKGQEDKSSNLWYVRVLQGFAGWLAAVFMLGFLGLGVGGLFEYPVAMMIMGVIINASAYVFFKSKSASDFFEQMVLAFSLTGQFVFAFGLVQFFGFADRQWLVMIGLYQIILVFLMHNYLHRFLSTWFAIIALFWGFEYVVYSGLGSALVAGLFVWIWLEKTGWEAEKAFYEPIGYALAFTLLQLNVQSQFWLFDLINHRNSEVTWMVLNAPWFSATLNAVILLYFVARIVKERQICLSSTTGKLIVLGTVLLLFSALPVIGVSSALLVLLLGFSRQRVLLMVLGGLALVGFVSWYYYSLNETLLFKSIVLILIGLVLLLAYKLLVKVTIQMHQETAQSMQIVTAVFSGRMQRIAVGITLVLCLLGVNHAIWKKEQLLDNGQSVFLELAPVDPRSLMQGDYMRLRFNLADKIRSDENTSKEGVDKVDGFVIIDVNAKGVGSFNALSQGQSLEANQLKLQYRTRKGRIQFATNAFFFQEGDAMLFDAARYGEFKVDDKGELLLKAMYDQDLKLLGENRLD